MTKYLGILGGGNISETHLKAAADVDGLQVSAVCGSNTVKVQHLAEMAQAHAYSDLETFLDHRPLDIVAIGSPSGLHAQQGIAACRKGLHLIVEKPIDIDTERADRLIGECHKAGVKLGVFFQDRVAPDIVRLQQLIGSGTLGTPLLVSAQVRWYRHADYYGQSKWRGTWELDGGGALINQAIHTVDLLVWLLGDVRRVSAYASTLLHPIEVEDTLVAALEFSQGTLATFEAATSAYPGYPRRVTVTGTEGTAILEHDELVAVQLTTEVEQEETSGARNTNVSSSSPVVSDVEGHRRLLADFLSAVEDDREPICNGTEGRRSVEIVQAIYQSARSGRPVDLS